MSIYRDELEAAQAYNRALAHELSQAQAEIAKLRSTSVVKKTPRITRSKSAVRRTAGGIQFSSPGTWFPLFRLWLEGLRIAFRWCLSEAFQPPKTGNVIMWLLCQLAKPIIFLARVVGIVILAVIVTPYSALNTTLYSIALLPIVLLSGLRFSNAGPQKRSWLHGKRSEDAVGVYWMITAGTPGVLPAGAFLGFVLPLLGL